MDETMRRARFQRIRSGFDAGEMGFDQVIGALQLAFHNSFRHPLERHADAIREVESTTLDSIEDLLGDDEFDPTEFNCAACGLPVPQDDAVWVDPAGAATTGDQGRPYHVECCPAQDDESP
jgi:hypothetical protein